jgi:hypothetical protein
VTVIRNIEPGVVDGQVVAYSGTAQETSVPFNQTVETTMVTLPITVPAVAESGDGSVQLGTVVTAEYPLTTSVLNPAGGHVSIRDGGVLAPSGDFIFLGRQIIITADEPASVDAPIQLTFTIHKSALVDPDGNPITEESVTVLRDGVSAGECSRDAAEPDPCVYSRTLDGDGNLTLVVLTSHASVWSVVASAAVTTPRAMTQSALVTLQAATVDAKAAKTLVKATDALRASLADNLWLDDGRLNPKTGSKVFDLEKQALTELNKKELAGYSQVGDVVDVLLDADRALTQTAIDDAVAANAKPKDVQAARDDLAKGDAARARGNYQQAVDSYKAAWQKAQKSHK